MSFKTVGGVFALLFIVGVASTGPQGDPGDSSSVAEFKTQCQRGVGTEQRDLCRCMAERIEGRIKSDSEFAMAGAVIRAIGEAQAVQASFATDTAFAMETLQLKFDRISEDFHTTVSLQRKAAILSMVTGSVQRCESQLARAKT